MTGRPVIDLVGGGVIGAMAGFLTRPCCVVPAALSIAGLGTAGLGDVFVAQRTLFVSSGALMLSASIWINVRRDSGWFNKMIAAGVTIAGFALSLRFVGVL